MRSLRESLTTRGTAFIASGVVLLLSGIALGQYDLSRIGVLLLLLPALSGLVARRHDLDVEVTRSAVPSRVSVDEPASVAVTLRNPGSTRTPLVMAEEQLDYALGDRPRFVIPAMRPGERREVGYTIRCHTRGRHRLGPLNIKVRDPFGLTLRSAQAMDTGRSSSCPASSPSPGRSDWAPGSGRRARSRT